MRTSQEPLNDLFTILSDLSLHKYFANLCKLRFPPSTVTINREKYENDALSSELLNRFCRKM